MNWIKVECSTPRKPELRTIARKCGVSAAEAFLGWFSLWVVFDTFVGSHGMLEGYCKEDADHDSGIPGMGTALEEVGWVTWTPTGCVITHWDWHNGESAKARALHARRQSTYRKRALRSRDGAASRTRDVRVLPDRHQIREEKIREDTASRESTDDSHRQS